MGTPVMRDWLGVILGILVAAVVVALLAWYLPPGR
jgi:hypothetical protein